VGGLIFFVLALIFLAFCGGVLLVVGWWVVVVAFPRLVARLLLCVSSFFAFPLHLSRIELKGNNPRNKIKYLTFLHLPTIIFKKY
jgi:hypothetical protein